MAVAEGAPPALARVLGYMVVCDPPVQSAADLQQHLRLSAGAVSGATRELIALGILEVVREPGDRRLYYRLHPDGWQRALEARLRQGLAAYQFAARALDAAGDEADDRLRDMHDLYAWVHEHLDDILAGWHSARRRTSVPGPGPSEPSGARS